MNGRPIRSRTRPESSAQNRPPGSLWRVLAGSGFAQVDPGGMRDIIASLADQIAAALRSSAKAHFPVDEAQRIFLVGMGGSAIAGDVFAAWAADRSKVPIQVVRDYRLPSYARSEDLLVAVSYSGNTEETLAATAQGIKLGCRVIAITSGGTLAELARKNDFSMFQVPAGLPPRGAFGHLFGILAAISGDWTVAEGGDELAGAVTHLKELRMKLRPERGMRSNPAKAPAVPIKPILTIIYPAPRDLVSGRLREPVPRGAATRRSAGPEADPSLEGEARRIPPNKLNARDVGASWTSSKESSTRRRMRFQWRGESQTSSP